MKSVLELLDDLDMFLGEARMAAQGQDEAAAINALDNARLCNAQIRVQIERPTGEFPRLKKPE